MRLVVLALCCLAACTRAYASITYTMIDRTCSVEALGTVAPCAGSYPPAFSITLSDAAIARGHFDLIGVGQPVSLTGDVADLLALTGAVDDQPGNGFLGRIDLHASFAPDGTILALSFYQYGASAGALLTGTSAALSGWFDDEGLCQHDIVGRLCRQSGRLLLTRAADASATIDEPATVPMIGTAVLLSIALVRARGQRRAG